jgi:Skp family chaperone for outer membrane proteins
LAALLFLPCQAMAQPASRSAPAATPAADAAPAEQPALSFAEIVARLPPAPQVAPTPPGKAPPTAVTGVLSIPDVMTQSIASQEAQKVLGARRQKLTEDEQKEQATLRDLSQQLNNERAKLSAEQIRVRERDLQDRLNDARKKFAQRNRIIQDAEQYCLVEIQRTMTAVVQQVAASRGMNFVIRREQVALNTADFDITPEVVAELNKAMPTLEIPPDGVAVLDMKVTAAAAATPPAATPAAAPAKH